MDKEIEKLIYDYANQSESFSVHGSKILWGGFDMQGILKNFAEYLIENNKINTELLRNQLSTNTWISVEDRLPIYNGAYLGFAKLKFGTLITVYHFNENKKQFDWVVPKTLPYKPEVTHWMPLPPAPTHK